MLLITDSVDQADRAAAGGRAGVYPEGRGGTAGGDSTSMIILVAEAVECRRKNEAKEFRLELPSAGVSSVTGFCPRGLNRANLLKDLGSDRLDFAVTVDCANVDL